MSTQVTEGGPPPPEQMLSMLTGFQITQALCVAAKLRIPDYLQNGTKHVRDLAQEAECDEEKLRRLLRTIASLGVFSEAEDKPGMFSNTPLSLTLQSDTPGSVRNYALTLLESHYQPFAHLLDIVKGSKETGPQLAYGCDFFEYLARNPKQNATFLNAMTDLVPTLRDQAFEFFDDSLCPEGAVVVDVGGANGDVLMQILEKCPGTKGIVMDLESAKSNALETIRKRGMSDRVTFKAGDFFDANTLPANSELYILAFILHDWADEKCLTILKNIKRVMKKGATIAILEMVAPVGSQPHMSRFMDMTMMGMVSGKERTLAEWETLLGDANLALKKVVPTPNPVSWLYAGDLAAE